MSVGGSEVAEIHTLKEVTLTEEAALDGVSRVLNGPTQAWHNVQSSPEPTLHCVVLTGGGDAEKVLAQSTHIGVDTLAIVVENDEDVGIGGSCIVESLKGKSTRHCAVANDSHHVALLPTDGCSLGKTIGCRNRHRRVTRTKRVALLPAREAGNASRGALRGKLLAPAGDDLVGIGLVAHIPDDVVGGEVEDVVESHGELHGTEARGEVAGVDGTALHDIAPEFGTVVGQLLHRQLLEVGGRIHPLQIPIILFCHSFLAPYDSKYTNFN